MSLDNLDKTEAQTFTVSQLNRRVKDLLEIHLPLLWVEGEISNLSKPSSGHWYFTLKDEAAQVSCAMFKRRSALVGFVPKAGDHIKVRAHVSLYEGRGNYQLIVEHMEEAGFGLLQRRFEELKNKLLGEGLFDSAAKIAVPCPPAHLAVITSPSGAAIRDVLSVLGRRFPALPVTIIPSPVQGDDAAATLAKQLTLADQSGHYDAILLCRGGGSLEDLWAFNNEALARAIYACKTPVVSAVGHEVDVTIADYVADVRAPTPSAAAEILSPDKENLLAHFRQFEAALTRRIWAHLQTYIQRVVFLRKRLKHPSERLQQWQQTLDHCELRLQRALRARLTRSRNSFDSHALALIRQSPAIRLQRDQERVSRLRQQLQRAMRLLLANRRQLFSTALARLDLVSPIATIERGYAIVRDQHNRVVRSVDSVQVGDALTLNVADGHITTTVNHVNKANTAK